MHIYPDLDTVKAIAAEGTCKVLPLSCEILADAFTPIEVLQILKNVSAHCYLLESVTEKEKWGRYTFLGFDPKLEITCLNGEMRLGEETFRTEDPSARLRELLAEYKSRRLPGLPPFTGGLVGYFSYDYLGYSEPSVRREVQERSDFRDMDLMLFDKVIAFDNFRQKIVLIANMSLADPEAGYREAAEELKKLRDLLLRGERRREPGGHLTGEVAPLFDREAYCAMVERAKGHRRYLPDCPLQLPQRPL